MSLSESLNAGWKFCLSFRKRDWELADYPVVIRRHSAPEFKLPARSTWYPYVAQIVNWWVMSGSGATADQAMEDLERQLARTKEDRQRDGKPMPRPGTSVEIEFAESSRVYANPELTDDFIRRVLGVEWALVSDQSSLWDFHADETNDALIAKIREVYGVDVSDIESGNLAMILERIAAS